MKYTQNCACTPTEGQVAGHDDCAARPPAKGTQGGQPRDRGTLDLALRRVPQIDQLAKGGLEAGISGEGMGMRDKFCPLTTPHPRNSTKAKTLSIV